VRARRRVRGAGRSADGFHHRIAAQKRRASVRAEQRQSQREMPSLAPRDDVDLQHTRVDRHARHLGAFEQTESRGRGGAPERGFGAQKAEWPRRLEHDHQVVARPVERERKHRRKPARLVKIMMAKRGAKLVRETREQSGVHSVCMPE
jgi:hypothetical protein